MKQHNNRNPIIMYKIVYALLQKNNIKNIDKEELKFQIQSHPSYPSLHAITGVLDHFGIENMALNMPKNNAVYEELPSSFIAHFKNENSEDIVFVKKTKNNIKLIYSDKKSKNQTKSEFLENWSGTVVVVDEVKTPIANIKKSSQFLKYIPILLLIPVFGFILFKNTAFSIFNFSHLILSFIGVYISVLLLKHELGINSETVEKLCTQSKKTSCDAVLNSKGATLFGLFKLSDVAIVYFTSLTLASILFFINNGLVFNVMAQLSLLAVPVILYSIYYQAVIVKKWCPLCLVTALVLLCQSLIAYFLNPFQFSFELNGFLILALSFLSVLILYTNIKPLIKSNLSFYKTKIEYYKFKRNFSLFNSLYSKNLSLETSLNTINEIVFGNPNAKIALVLITNPLCGYCKATHKAVANLLKNSNDLKVTIRFNINTDTKEDVSYKIATVLLNLYQNDKIACLDAMHQIYTDGVNIENWLITYAKYTKVNQQTVLEVEKNWCTEKNINFTPAVYVNNKEYPKEYDLSDLSFFMEDLVDLSHLSHLPSSRREETSHLPSSHPEVSGEETEQRVQKTKQENNVIQNNNVNLKHDVIPTE